MSDDGNYVPVVDDFTAEMSDIEQEMVIEQAQKYHSVQI